MMERVQFTGSERDTRTLTAAARVQLDLRAPDKSRGEKHEGWKRNIMMDRCNIERLVSRGGEEKATSSRGRLSPLPPITFHSLQ